MKIELPYKNIIMILGIIFVAGFLFYWFQIRPSNIKKNCLKEENIINLGSSYAQGRYKTCLARYGL